MTTDSGAVSWTRSYWAIPGLTVALYGAALFLTYPNVIVVSDEDSYLRQAVAFARGQTRVAVVDPLTTSVRSELPSSYPVGTSALQAPLVRLFGWRGGILLSFLALAVSVLALARWLVESGRSAIWSTLLLAYPPALVMGRVAMSDVPSCAALTIALWLFFRGPSRSIWNWLGSGFLAGASLLFRDTNPLVIAPFFAGAVVRRERRLWALVVAGLAGTALRPLTAFMLSGNPFLTHPNPYGWTLRAAVEHLPLYAFILTVLVPGGLIGCALYRGARRAEVLTSVSAFVGLYLAYEYGASESGGLKQVVLAGRYFLPVLPLIVFAMAESVPRVLLTRGSPIDVPSTAARVGWAWTGLVCVEVVCATAVMTRWERSQRAIVDTIYGNTTDESVVVTYANSTGKFINDAYGHRLVVDRQRVSPLEVSHLRARGPDVTLAFLDRSGSDFWREEEVKNSEFVRAVGEHCDLVLTVDTKPTSQDHLRMWRLGGCR